MPEYDFTNDNMGDVQAAVAAGVAAAETEALTEHLHTVADGHGKVRVVDTRDWDDRYLEHPRRKAGNQNLTEAASFVDYVERHGNEFTELFVLSEQQIVRAVIDSHGTVEAGHGEHTANLVLPKSDQWKLWVAANGRSMRQRDFTEFVEDNLVDIVEPAGADMQEIVSSLSATSKATFHSSHRLSDGSSELEWSQTIDAKAGTKKQGKVDIPSAFTIAIPVFRGAPAWKIRARFRYRITDGQLAMSFHLDRLTDILAAAFEKEVKTVREDLTEFPIFVS